MNKENFRKNHNKKKPKRKKKPCRETLQQPIVFHEKLYSSYSQPAQY